MIMTCSGNFIKLGDVMPFLKGMRF